jgi:hypothetical protein
MSSPKNMLQSSCIYCVNNIDLQTTNVIDFNWVDKDKEGNPLRRKRTIGRIPSKVVIKIYDI